MKFLKITALVLVFFVILFFAIGLFLPGETHVERSIKISAADSVVFKLISEHKEFQRWSPWSKKDPNIELTFSGPEVGVGSTTYWASEDPHVGNGTSVYTVYEPNVKAVTELSFDQGGGTATYEISNVEGEEGVVIVTWGFDTLNKTVIEKYFGIMMDRILGPMYETGLAALKEIAESEPIPVVETRFEIVTEDITYSVDGVQLNGFAARPAGDGEYPGILVVHEWWGHNDYARKRAKMLAERGYSAFALDMYGDGKLADHPDKAMEFMNAIINNAESAKTRFTAAVKVLQNQPNTDNSKLAAMGYCFGGAVVMSMARLGLPLDGVVSFHGGLAGLAPIGEPVKAKFLVFNGQDDPFVKAEHKVKFKQDMDGAGLNYEFIDFPETKHSFTVQGADEIGAKFNLPLAYNEEADKISWETTQAFLTALFEK